MMSEQYNYVKTNC